MKAETWIVIVLVLGICIVSLALFGCQQPLRTVL
jgi:hypothetical protein